MKIRLSNSIIVVVLNNKCFKISADYYTNKINFITLRDINSCNRV